MDQSSSHLRRPDWDPHTGNGGSHGPSTEAIQSFRTAPDPHTGYGSAGSPARAPGGDIGGQVAADQARGNGHRGNGHGRLREQGNFDPHQASTGQLVSQAASQISTLVRTELALGRAELMEKGRKLGLGGGMLAAAGLLSFFALALVFTLVVVLLDLVMPLWVAVLVTLLFVGALTLGLAGLGVRRIKAGAQAPTQTRDSVRDDIRSVKHAFQEGRHWQ